jgi:hypothetical protein
VKITILFVNSEGKRQIVRPRSGYDGNTVMGFEETAGNTVD